MDFTKEEETVARCEAPGSVANSAGLPTPEAEDKVATVTMASPMKMLAPETSRAAKEAVFTVTVFAQTELVDHQVHTLHQV